MSIFLLGQKHCSTLLYAAPFTPHNFRNRHKGRFSRRQSMKPYRAKTLDVRFGFESPCQYHLTIRQSAVFSSSPFPWACSTGVYRQRQSSIQQPLEICIRNHTVSIIFYSGKYQNAHCFALRCTPCICPDHAFFPNLN